MLKSQREHFWNGCIFALCISLQLFKYSWSYGGRWIPPIPGCGRLKQPGLNIVKTGFFVSSRDQQQSLPVVLGVLPTLEIFQNLKIMYITNNVKVLLLFDTCSLPLQAEINENMPKNLKMKQELQQKLHPRMNGP